MTENPYTDRLGCHDESVAWQEGFEAGRAAERDAQLAIRESSLDLRDEARAEERKFTPPAPVSHGDATVHTGDWVSYSDSLSTLSQNLEALQLILPFGYVPLDQEPAPGDESEET